jgi:hypothetical protein
MKKYPSSAVYLILVALIILVSCLILHHHSDGEESAHCDFCLAVYDAGYTIVCFIITITLALIRFNIPVEIFRRATPMVLTIDDRAPPGNY